MNGLLCRPRFQVMALFIWEIPELHYAAVRSCTKFFIDRTSDERKRKLKHTKKYVGLTASEFKTRHASHKTSMRHERYANSTELSKYIWQLSNQQTEHSLSWTILERACPYSNAGKRCNLCIAEAYHILHADKDMALNKRSELVSTCRHQKKFTLAVSAVT